MTMRLIEESKPLGMRLIDEDSSISEQKPLKGMRLIEDKPSFTTKINEKIIQPISNVVKPLYNYLGENEPESQNLIPNEEYVPPKATTDPRLATLQLLPHIPDVLREDFLDEIKNLIKEDKLFTEEAINRLPLSPEISREILLTGQETGKPFKREISYPQALKEGFQESVSGIVSGQGVQDYKTLIDRAQSELPFLKRQLKNVTKIVGDLPAFITGGALASLPAGGPETPLGAVLAGSGAFATQELIQSGYNEALRLVAENPELKGKTLEQLVKLVSDPESLKNIGLSTLEAGTIGAIVALNPLMRALEKTPLKSLFTKPLVNKAANLGTEVATLTTVPAALHGKIPTAQDFIDNAVLLGGLKISGAAASKLAKWAKRTNANADKIESRLGEKFTKQDEIRIADAKTPEEVDSILKDIESRETRLSSNNEKEIPKMESEKMLKEEKPESKLTPTEQRATLNREEPVSSVSTLQAKRQGLIQPEQARRSINLQGTEKNVPKKSNIIQIFKDAFQDTPIRIGKFPPKLKSKASGFYKLGNNVIRLKEAGMIETAAHEFGHKLHMALFGGEGDIKTQLKNINNALKPYMDELKPISRYEPHDLEGFAEFSRMYVTNPKALETLTPSFLKFFESEMQKKAPKVLESMKEAREMYEQYLNADPVARTYSHIQSSFDRNLWQKVGDWYSKTFNLDSIKKMWLDDLFPIKRAVADTVGIEPVQVENWVSPLNAYTQARVLKGWVGKSEVFLAHETFNANTLQKNGKGLKEILQPIKTVGERQELSAYLVAKRAQLLEKRNIKSGLDVGTISKTISKLKDKYESISEELNEYQNRVLEYYRDSGMLSHENYLKIKSLNPFYVPFFRFFEEGEKRNGQRTGGDTGRLQASKQIKQIFGSSREVIDPLESIINNTFAMIQSAEKNRFGQTLSKLTQINPRGGKFMERIPPKMTKAYEVQRQEIIEAMISEAKKKDIKLSEVGADEAIVKLATAIIPETIEKWRPQGWGPSENVVTIYHDGKPQYYETTPEIADLYKRGGSQVESSILVKLLSLPARIKRAGAILNPRFIQKNAIRDLLGSVLFTKHTGKPIIDDVYRPFEGLLSAIRKDKTYVDWLKAGGGMATMQSIDKNLMQVKKGLGKGLEKVRPIALMRRVAEISEEMNRLSEYTKAVAAMGNDRWQKEMAAFQSRDLSIDFAKYGSYAKALNQIIPFWNATIQGGDKLIRTLASKDPKVIQNFMTRVTAGVIMPSLLLQVANDDDKDIAEVDEVTKDTNFLFRDPISNEIIQIPVPFETGVLFHGLTRRLYNFIVKEDPKAFDGFFGSIENASLPGFIPAATEPFLEVWANKDFFRNRHIVHPSKVGLISEEQYGVFTSPTARLIGKAMTYLLGNEGYQSSLASPDIIEHFIRSYGAGLGGLALKFSDESLRAIGIQPAVVKPEEKILDRLGLSAFTKNFPTAKTKSVDEFYDTYDLWKRLDKSIKAKIEKNDVEGAKRLQKEKEKLSKLDIERMAKAMQKNQALINNIYNNPKMTAQEKAIMIEKFYRQQIIMAKSFMDAIKKKN